MIADTSTSTFGMLAATIAGTVSTVYGLSQVREATASASWPTTQGRITDSALVEGRPSGRIVQVARYRAAVTYTYTAEGKQRVGSRVFVEDVSEGYESAHNARLRQRRYDVGATVMVYVDPADPSRSLLEPGATWAHWKYVAFGGLMFAVSISGLLGWVRA